MRGFFREILDLMSTIIIKDSSKDALSSLREDFNIPLDASCGGKGTCGKCRIRIVAGEIDPPGEGERKFLSEKDISGGIRLACYITPRSELHVHIDHNAGPVRILEDHDGYDGVLNLPVAKTYLNLEKPGIADQRDDLTRILDRLGKGNLSVSLKLRRRIPSILRESDFKVTAVYSESELMALEPGNSEDRNFAVACDIGTTTVVAYLLDGNSGEIVDKASDLNAQKPFGADVIARIEYVQNNREGLKILQEKKLKQLEELISRLLSANGIDSRHLYTVTVAGNTTMLHLLAGADPSGIAAAPFIPVFLDSFACRSFELGNFFTDCLFYFMPSISAYVGADITAGVLATAMDRTEELCLLVDLGTNGEIILGNRDGYISCSTAAGPAFEGAHIHCGMGALDGAVNTVDIRGNSIEYTVIGDSRPRGICGSAIVDITAAFLEAGIVDETGRLAEEDELDSDDFRSRRIEDAFVLVPEDRTGGGAPVLFTQKDIREVQLAKAAIAAGIETLLHESGREKSDIRHVYIAGGFGNYIRKESAARMGLIPGELLDRTVSVGNTAGLGAINCALNRDSHDVCREIVGKTKYVELSANNWFQQKYMEEMTF